MKSNDQYFKPGDKVMVVNGNTGNYEKSDAPSVSPKKGIIYCVEDFQEYTKKDWHNVVILVGFGGWRYDDYGHKVGWPAKCFRKVEEIKLCINSIKNCEIKIDSK